MTDLNRTRMGASAEFPKTAMDADVRSVTVYPFFLMPKYCAEISLEAVRVGEPLFITHTKQRLVPFVQVCCARILSDLTFRLSSHRTWTKSFERQCPNKAIKISSSSHKKIKTFQPTTTEDASEGG